MDIDTFDNVQVGYRRDYEKCSKLVTNFDREKVLRRRFPDGCAAMILRKLSQTRAELSRELIRDNSAEFRVNTSIHRVCVPSTCARSINENETERIALLLLPPFALRLNTREIYKRRAITRKSIKYTVISAFLIAPLLFSFSTNNKPGPPRGSQNFNYARSSFRYRYLAATLVRFCRSFPSRNNVSVDGQRTREQRERERERGGGRGHVEWNNQESFLHSVALHGNAPRKRGAIAAQ